MASSGIFKMDVDRDNKVFTAFAEGFFSMEQGKAFCDAFIETAKDVSKYGDYTLIVDAKGVKPSSPEVTQALADAMSLYVSKEFKFKKRFITRLTSAVAQTQVDRLSRSIEGFSSQMTFVNTKEEALKLI